MMHMLWDDHHWFESRHWLHTRPVRWQGHMLVAMFLLALTGIGVAQERGKLSLAGCIGAIIMATALFIVITIRRTAKRR